MNTPTAGPSGPPAGWYPDPKSSSLRWWDGQRWADQWAPAAGSPTGSFPPQSAAHHISPTLATASGQGTPSQNATLQQSTDLAWPTPQQSPKTNRFTILWVGLAIFVVGVFGSIIASTFSDGEDKSTNRVEVPTDPQSLAGTLETLDDASLKDPVSYRELDDADFKQVMYPSGDLEEYPYPFVGSRIVLYGVVDELAPGYDAATGGTYFEATLLNYDLGPLASWDLDSRDAAVVGMKTDLGDLEPGDNVAVFAEVRRPYLTGEKMFDSALRDPYLVAHVVRVIR